MYYQPRLHGSQEYMNRIAPEDINMCKRDCMFRKCIPCDEDVYNLCIVLMAQENLDMPEDAYSGLNLYLRLRELVRQN
jgi:hypothetical protein